MQDSKLLHMKMFSTLKSEITVPFKCKYALTQTRTKTALIKCHILIK